MEGVQRYKLGQVLQGRHSRLLVVRIVKSQTLFEESNGECYILDEHYIELRNTKGQASFIRLASQRLPFTEGKGNIKALDPVYLKEESYGEIGTTRSEDPGEGYNPEG